MMRKTGITRSNAMVIANPFCRLWRPVLARPEQPPLAARGANPKHASGSNQRSERGLGRRGDNLAFILSRWREGEPSGEPTIAIIIS